MEVGERLVDTDHLAHLHQVGAQNVAQFLRCGDIVIITLLFIEDWCYLAKPKHPLDDLVLGGVAGDEVVKVGDDIDADRTGQLVPALGHGLGEWVYDMLSILKFLDIDRDINIFKRNHTDQYI